MIVVAGNPVLRSAAAFELRPPTRALTLISIAFLLMIVHYVLNGAHMPDTDIPKIWATLSPDGISTHNQFLLDNSLFNLLGHGLTELLGGKQISWLTYFFISLAMVFVCVATLLIASIVSLGVERAAIFLSVIALSTLDHNLLHWLGKSDPLLISVYAVVFFNRKHVVISALGFAAMVGLHAEQTVVIAIVHIVMLRFDRSFSWRIFGAIIIGIGVGLLGARAYSLAFGLENLHSRVNYAVSDGAAVILRSMEMFVTNVPLSVATILLGVWWLALRAMAESRRNLVLLAVALLTVVAVAACVLDYSRDAALFAMPIIFTLAEQAATRWKEGEGLSVVPAILLAAVALIGVGVNSGFTNGATDRPFLSFI